MYRSEFVGLFFYENIKRNVKHGTSRNAPSLLAAAYILHACFHYNEEEFKVAMARRDLTKRVQHMMVEILEV